jgi:RNA polymerase Rpb2, domain 5
VDTEEEETTMIAMHINDLHEARTAVAQGGHAYSSSYTHCEVCILLAALKRRPLPMQYPRITCMCLLHTSGPRLQIMVLMAICLL